MSTKIDDNKVKHLEFILKIIDRMAANSFYLKSWTVTLNAALIALVIKNQFSYGGLIGLMTTYLFWVLDAYYLSIERKYRKLYDEVRLATDDLKFTLNVSHFNNKECSIFNAFASLNLVVFFLTVLIANVLIILFLP